MMIVGGGLVVTNVFLPATVIGVSTTMIVCDTMVSVEKALFLPVLSTSVENIF